MPEDRPSEEDIDNLLLNRLDRVSNEILSELRYLRTELSARPTRHEQTAKRRGAIFVIALGVYTAFQLFDSYISKCGPGAQAKDGIDYVARTGGTGDFRIGELRRLLSDDVPQSCDMTMPFSAHAAVADWPTAYNLMGMGVYVLMFGMLYLWYKWPLWTSRQPTPPPPPMPDPRPLPEERPSRFRRP